VPAMSRMFGARSVSSQCRFAPGRPSGQKLHERDAASGALGEDVQGLLVGKKEHRTLAGSSAAGP
jgi:hypothetical protein